MKADRLAGIVTVAAGLGLAALTAQVDILSAQQTLSARFFPYLLAGAMISGGAVLFFKPGPGVLSTVTDRLLDRRGIALAGLFLIYALTFRYVDFRFGTWTFVLGAMWILGSRSWLELLITPVAVSAAAYTLFRYGFTVLLPTWT